MQKTSKRNKELRETEIKQKDKGVIEKGGECAQYMEVQNK